MNLEEKIAARLAYLRIMWLRELLDGGMLMADGDIAISADRVYQIRFGATTIGSMNYSDVQKAREGVSVLLDNLTNYDYRFGV